MVKTLHFIYCDVAKSCDNSVCGSVVNVSQTAFTCSNLTIETLEQGVKYVQR